MSEVIELQRQALAVDVRDLRKEFSRRDKKAGRFARKKRAALHGVTFTMERGECVAILGQNGSGKSTLVRLLSTLLFHDGGSAHVFGHDVFANPRPVRRLVNRVSVEASFFKKMSAGENLHYAARYYGMGPRETRVKIPDILGKVGFPIDRRSEPMENLSRGMQQKVALARALLTSPVLAASGRADDRARSALEARGAGVRPRPETDARLDNPALHARPRGGGGTRGPCRDPRPRRAALPRDRAGDPGALQGRDARAGVLRRDRTRVRGGESTRTTRTGRCSHDPRGSSHVASRADRARRRGRAQRLPHPPLHLVGRRVHDLDDREHAHDRLHREGDRGDGRIDRRHPDDDDAADRRRRLGLPRDPVRVHDRDGGVGALGGDDRVHVHGAALPRDASRGRGLLRRALRADPGDHPLHRRRVLLRPGAAERQLRRRLRRARRGARSRSSGSGS